MRDAKISKSSTWGYRLRTLERNSGMRVNFCGSGFEIDFASRFPPRRKSLKTDSFRGFRAIWLAPSSYLGHSASNGIIGVEIHESKGGLYI